MVASHVRLRMASSPSACAAAKAVAAIIGGIVSIGLLIAAMCLSAADIFVVSLIMTAMALGTCLLQERLRQAAKVGAIVAAAQLGTVVAGATVEVSLPSSFGIQHYPDTEIFVNSFLFSLLVPMAMGWVAITVGFGFFSLFTCLHAGFLPKCQAEPE